MRKHHKSESGQAIFLIAFGLVALLGMTSLAIDGGRVYSDRRKAQNTADTSAFAGALLIAQSNSGDPYNLPGSTENAVEAAAKARAISNGYDDSDPAVDVDVDISGPHTDNGIYYLVRVEITSEIETTFAHLVYDGKLKNTVYAIAKARPQQNVGYGFAMFGTSLNGCKTIWFAGNNNTTITGGGILSNSSASAGNCPSMQRNGSGNVNVSGGTIGTAGSFKEIGSGSINPSVDTMLGQQEIPFIQPPDCGGLLDQGEINLTGSGTTTIDPGIYGKIKVGANHNLVMNPGMYCITGSTGFTGTGGDISGNGVLIYLVDGDFNLGGNTKVKLFASTNLIDASGQQWAGMLIYMDINNDGQIVLTGSSGTKYRGTIYAAGPANPESKPKCIVEGGAGQIGISSQIICYSIKLTGNANINLKYNAAQNFQLPASLGLQE